MTTKRAVARAAVLVLLLEEVTSNVFPAKFSEGDFVASLRDYGEAPVRTVSCVGPQRSGKTTLMKSIFGAEAGSLEDGLALLEADSDCAYSPDVDEFNVGTGRAMISLAISDVMIYNVMVHDLRQPDALSELQVSRRSLHRCSRLPNV